MKIREATANDIPQIKEIWNHYIRTSLVTFKSIEKTNEGVAEAIECNPVFIVAETDQIIGFATCFQFRGGEGYVHAGEHTVMFAPDQLQQGYGRSLMNALEEHAKNAGYRSLTAGICSQNQSALKFHEKIGYKNCGELAQVGYKFDRWLNLVLMQKIL